MGPVPVGWPTSSGARSQQGIVSPLRPGALVFAVQRSCTAGQVTSVKARLHYDHGLFLKYKLWASRCFVIIFSKSRVFFLFLFLDVSFFLTKVLRLRFQSSYIGGKERARNLLSDARENDF